jgi:hypothetical protein
MMPQGANKTSSKFIRETQISKTECIEICKSNNPAESGGYNTPSLGTIFGTGLALGFIPLIGDAV